MTNTAAHPSLAERAREWIRHETTALSHKNLVVELATKVHELETRLAQLEALIIKDGPVVEQAVKVVVPVAEQAIADTTKVAG